MNSQEIFIFEYISGGGFNRIQIPSSLLCEGYSMLRSLISDFSKVGFKIKTLLDKRIEFLSSFLDADKILSVSSKENFITKFSQMLNETTYCFIIAPEFSKILYNLTKKALKSKSILLSQNVKAIKLGSSKFVTFDYFKKKRLPTPRTFKFNVRDGIFEIEKLFREGKIKFPFIIKPDEGVGAENVFLVQSTNSLTYIFNHLEDILKDNKYVVQEYIDGIGLSGSILGIKNTQRITKSRCKLLSINFQNISFKDEFHDSEYLGGYTPYDVEESLKKKIRIYLKLLKSPDLSGYFGVDFVLSNEKINFIEINPRLTTSYLGLRNILSINPAELIYKAKFNQLDDLSFNSHGNSIYKRIDMKYNGRLSKKKIIDSFLPELLTKLPELITPPIAIEENKPDYYSFLVATHEKTLEDSEKKINEIIDFFQTHNFIKIEKK